MGDGDLPPLEHVRAGIEAVHDEAEKPLDRQPRASRQGPPRHLRCAGTTTVAAAGSRSTGPDMPFALGWSFARCSTAASLSGAPLSPTARCSTSQWGSTASTSHLGQSSSLVGFLRRDTSDTGKKSAPRSSILPITSCLVVASSMRAIHRMSKRNTRPPYAAATRPSPPPP
jgi:hypothetical protein